MSVEVVGPPSPTPSLIEVKEETRLVLKSFLRKALSSAPADRPGRIGGEYHDPNKFSALLKEKQRKDESEWDSLDEQISAAEEKKHGIKNLIKRRLKPRPSTSGKSKKDGSADQSQNGTLERQSGQEKGLLSKNGNTTIRSLKEDEKSSASEEEGERKLNEKKKKKNKLKLSELFLKKKSLKKEDRPVRPSSLPIDKTHDPSKPALSPSHPPEFYDGVAHTLDRIAQDSVKRKSPVKPEPIQPKEHDKEAIVQALVQVLTTEGDAINEKINANPLLRSSLNRLSYASFAKLLDTCASESVDPPLPARVSPTLRRVAITMEVTRRVVTATGVPQRVEGFAERYMENFAPWVKSHGGWESIVQMEAQEYD
ncbi:bcl-2-like protein 12 [Pygocentrus nattereri]|uniref:Uncharacterized protein n=1 Tax=Pygocentrus nattereri TaxID=42514 RepID=A0AAR2K9U1_PYGNA|nr:bcl-2-like protein 12 [Pygocentrus nattereri]XP_037400708.1 bcl-2-like protein 12 [Pygocentrus nattereri]XP_037400709.1 bcl-2-like protein 12 [Pygocentrus nattereri]